MRKVNFLSQSAELKLKFFLLLEKVIDSKYYLCSYFVMKTLEAFFVDFLSNFFCLKTGFNSY